MPRHRAVVVTAASFKTGPAICELQVSDDGARFRTVRRFDTGWRTGFAAFGSITAAFPEARGRYFRMTGTDLAGGAANGFRFEPVGSARVDLWEMKAGFLHIREHGGGAHMYLPSDQEPLRLPAAAAIPRQGVIDLTARLDPAGRLDWDVPEGDWTVLRIGHRPTGANNGPATAEGKGLDCDKLSRAATDVHFAGMLAKLIEDSREFAGKSFAYVHNDSWECGSQTWTAEFRAEFRKRRGYDLLPYLPAMAGGRVVDGYDISERFLWDVRRTIADMMTEYHWERLGELARARGLRYSLEPAGRQQFLYDAINTLSKGDLPMGEFWMTEERARPDCKLAASTAHIYGKPVAGAEAFTCNGGPGGEWKAHPFWLKAKGDQAFCRGVNRLVFHRYIHQPYLDRKPGMHWGTVGTQIERTQTWWQAGAAWTGYLSRCQFLLQRGVFVGDVCYLTGEGVPNALVRPGRKPPVTPEGEDASINTERSLERRGGLPPRLREGYDFDACNPESVMRMSVRDGRLVLPGGMSYRVLVLPVATEMTPALLRKIRDLVQAGAVVVGAKPAGSPSLSDGTAGDEEVRSIAAALWGGCDGKKIVEHAFGKGRVYWGKPLADVLAALGVKPDFTYAGRDADLDYIHRRESGADIYFVSNQLERAEEVECTFRVAGKQPELWFPDTGRIVEPAACSVKDGLTSLSLRLDPAGSLFVVFRKPRRARSVVSFQPSRTAELNAASDGSVELIAWQPGTYEIETSSGRRVVERVERTGGARVVMGPWELRFPANQGAPERIVLNDLISWTAHPDAGVKHFSGSATYVRELDIPAEWTSAGRRVHLDLGTVKEIAEVALNGKSLGVLWKPSFRVDVSGALKPGANLLEVKVTNLWPNRMIGDQKLPEGRRFTWTNSNPYTADSPLLESGLIGPVTLHVAERRAIRI